MAWRQLQLGPVPHRVVARHQPLVHQPRVGAERVRHRAARGGVVRQVHDDAHPRVHLVGGAARGAQRGARPRRPALLDGRGRGHLVRPDLLEQRLHVLDVARHPLEGGQLAHGERGLQHPLLPPAVKAQHLVAPPHAHARGRRPARRLGRVHGGHPVPVQRRQLQRRVAQRGQAGGVRRGAGARARLHQGPQRLQPARLLLLADRLQRRGPRARQRRVGQRVARGIAAHHHHAVRVRQPHVPQVAVLAQPGGVVLLDLGQAGGQRLLHQLVRVHALQRHLRHHAQPAQPHLGQRKQLGLAVGRQAEGAQPGRGELEAHHLVVDGRDGGARAVRAHLREAAHLLVAYARVVLQRQPVRLERVRHSLHARARLHRHLLLVGVHLDDAVHERHAHHAPAAEARAVGAQA
mmetsp:Transcript_29097/g.74252  ORF Transcript_29097/g.74252 Transcript_29097/m.74252 type:complete len:406 (+) Transcript_29097:449-1666(+)